MRDDHEEGGDRAEMIATTRDETCEGCPIVRSRRQFLRDMGIVTAAALIASGLRPSAVFAAAVAEASPLRRIGKRFAYAIPPADGVSVDSDNDVIIARWKSRVYAFSMKCPHRGARLQWRESESKIFCPKHKARFTPDGEHSSGRRTTSLDRYDIRRENRELVIDFATVYKQDEDPSAWAKAVLLL